MPVQPNPLIRNLGQTYLLSVIPLGLILGVATWRLNYWTYVPICLINALLMAVSAWVLGAHAIKSKDEEKKHLVFIATCLIAPWAFIFLFSFLGPPPETSAEFVATATEQKVRYAILVASGISIALGLAVLREKLKVSGEYFYSTLGFTAMMIAAPLFVLEMTLLGNYAIELFKIQLASPSGTRPEWFRPVAQQFAVVGIVEVALLYLATAAFAASLKRAGWLRKAPATAYMTISLAALFLVASIPLYFKGFFPLLIPAMPFILPLFIGISLLRRAGN